ncbi:hypothetical protein [Paenibacillus sp. ISL-20]|uniref:hypothetical protein n=1 Tax=Paenibacillus sp. ISL-20 TaxID=2819163 RepID=UPI00333BB0EE
MRESFKRLVEHRYFQSIIIGIIFLNGMIIVAETHSASQFLVYLDKIILGIFPNDPCDSGRCAKYRLINPVVAGFNRRARVNAAYFYDLCDYWYYIFQGCASLRVFWQFP